MGLDVAVGPPDPTTPPHRGASDARMATRMGSLAGALELAVMLLACAVLCGWALDLALARSVFPDLATMKANTAVGLLMAAISLRLARAPWTRHPALAAWGRACAAAVVFLGLVSLAESPLAIDAGLDELLFKDAPSPITAHPGRMSPLTASCLVLYGSALLALGRARRPWLPQLLAVATGGLGGAALLGYLYSVKGLYELTSATEMAVPTALAMVLLALGLLCADSNRGPMALLTSDGNGGVMARRLLPAVVVAPVVLGWLRLQGQRAGHYGAELSMAMGVIVTIGVLSAFVWQNGRTLQRLDETRRRAEAALRQREAHLRGILDSALDAVVTADAQGRVTFWSRAAESMFGWTREEALGRRLAELIIPERLREAHDRGLRHYLDTGESGALGRRLELMALRRDGIEFPVELCVTAVATPHGPSFSGFVADRSRQTIVEDALRRSELRYRQFFEEDLAGALVSRADGTIVDCNPAFLRMFGFASREQALRTNAAALYPTPDSRGSLMERLREQGSQEALDLALRRIDGVPIDVIANVVVSLDEHGDVEQIKGYLLDVTRRRQAEEQLRHSQRIDAIGRLAGGVAHDFNNLLGVITGYDDLLAKQVPPGGVAARYVGEIRKAADRAAGLTRQLLAFSRKQMLKPRVLDLDALILGLETLLARLIGEHIQVVTCTDPGQHRVKADPGQIEQVLMNLAVNSRDAMPDGGTLTLETGHVVLDQEYVTRHPGAQAGAHVLLAVSDTGYGMDAATRARLFEPFFTTKEPGQGTGLGLSTVYGIVKQSGGSIWVYSEPGLGTTFKVYLPAIDEPVQAGLEPSATREPPAIPRGHETILLVEDEDQVREIVREALEGAGYTVLQARQGLEALGLAEQAGPTLQLLITDSVMPGMGGAELARHLRLSRPGLPVVLMSGYTVETVARNGTLSDGLAFLQKPFTIDTLARAVRAALDGAETAATKPEDPPY